MCAAAPTHPPPSCTLTCGCVSAANLVTVSLGSDPKVEVRANGITWFSVTYVDDPMTALNSGNMWGDDYRHGDHGPFTICGQSKNLYAESFCGCFPAARWS